MLLDIYRKPVVLFDVNNQEHRKDYAKFIQTGSWLHCDRHYEICTAGGHSQGIIQRQLLEYYMTQEFVAKPQLKVG
jgi:hypothetical protein